MRILSHKLVKHPGTGLPNAPRIESNNRSGLQKRLLQRKALELQEQLTSKLMDELKNDGKDD